VKDFWETKVDMDIISLEWSGVQEEEACFWARIEDGRRHGVSKCKMKAALNWVGPRKSRQLIQDVKSKCDDKSWKATVGFGPMEEISTIA